MMSGPINSLSRALVLVGLAGIVSWILTFAGVILIARRLGHEAFGLFNLGQSLAICATALIAPNLNVWGSRMIAADPQSATLAVVMVKGTQILAATVCVVGLSGVYQIALAGSQRDVATCSTVLLFGAAINLQWVAQGLERFDLIPWNQLLRTVWTLIFIAATIHGAEDVCRAPVALVSGQILGSILVLVILAKAGVFKPLTAGWTKKLSTLATASIFGWTSLFDVFIQYSGFLSVQLFTNTSTLGLYGAGAQIYLAFSLAPAMLATVFFSRTVRSLRQTLEAGRQEIETWLMIALFLGGLPTALIIGDPQTVSRVLFGVDYDAAAPVLRAAAIAIFFNFVGTTYLMALLANNQDRVFLKAKMVAATVALLGTLVIYFFGLMGAAVVLATLDLAALLAAIFAFRRNFGSMLFSSWIRPIMGIVAASAVTMVLSPSTSNIALPFLMSAITYVVIASPWRTLRSMFE